MSVILEIDNNSIRMLNGTYKNKTISLQHYHEIRLNEQEQDLQHQTQLIEAQGWKMNKTSIVLSNSSVMYREMKLPRVDEKRMQQIVKNEMKSTMVSNADMICDYLVLSSLEKEKADRVLVSAVTKEKMDEYISLLKSLKCRKPGAIDVGYNALFKYLNLTSLENETKPMILAEIGEAALKLYLFDEGQFILVRSLRMPAHQEQDETVSFITDSISKMQQFQLSRHYQQNVQAVYCFGAFAVQYCPLLKARFDILVEPMPQAKFSAMPQDFPYLEYIYALGAMVRM